MGYNAQGEAAVWCREEEPRISQIVHRKSYIAHRKKKNRPEGRLFSNYEKNKTFLGLSTDLTADKSSTFQIFVNGSDVIAHILLAVATHNEHLVHQGALLEELHQTALGEPAFRSFILVSAIC